MNKFIIAFAALLAVAHGLPMPGYGHSYLGPAALQYSAPASIAYQEIALPVSNYHAAPVSTYHAAPVSSYHSAPSRSVLVAAPSDPRAAAKASAASGGLNSGLYSKLAIPSYSIVSGVPADNLGGMIVSGLPAGNYGSASGY